MHELLLFSAMMAPRYPRAIHAGNAEMPAAVSLAPDTAQCYSSEVGAALRSADK